VTRPSAGPADPGAELDLAALDRELAGPTAPPAETWRPLIVRLAGGEFERLAAICREHRLTLVDTLDRQLRDWAAVRLPSAGAADRAGLIADTIARHGGPEACGNWIYVPWEARVVHLLDRERYFEVITDRNRDKITREEQHRLRTKCIGVIGLSVGGEAAITLAQEHLCGEIVLADFDQLDPSNLNRLGAGYDDLGLNKAVIVARRVAKLDPYLTVRVFPEGVTDTNLDAFLDGLDLLVDECDGLRIKHEVRRRARNRGLNVVFAADERGFLSVEPYGYRPDLDIFHGRMAQPQAPRESYQTPLAFLAALTEWMGGWSAISERSRRSLEQIGSTLGGYPQLAGEARLAAAQISHVARRLLLGERLPPSLGYLDLDRWLAPASS
jgi:molybdopterin/thiamine biosynthesis adenylyltransferase